MSKTQRYVLLGVAAVIAVLAIVVLPGDDDDDDSPTSPAAQTTTAPAASEPTAGSDTETTATAPKPEPKPQPPLLTPGKVRELEYKKGDTVRFRVRASKADQIHVHGYDLSKPVVPGKTTTMSFEATIEGIFEIELEQSGIGLASLKVEPK